MMFGLDHLGLAQYPKKALQTFPDRWALGCFAETFGNSLDAVSKILATRKVAAFRVHLLWDDDHIFGEKEVNKALKLFPLWHQLAIQFPNVHFFISPFCEHNLKAPDPILNKFQKLITAENCKLVNCVYNGTLSKKYINEVHGDTNRPATGDYIYSYDGSPCVDENVERLKKQHQGALIHFFWTSQFNGRKNPNDKTSRPRRKAWPTKELIESIIYLANPKGPTSLPRDYLWKSHADQHEAPKPEPRALKPVFISPKKIDYYTLRDPHTGKLIDNLKYFGPFDGGGHRYYAGDFGYKLNDKSTIFLCSIHEGKNGKEIGTVNAAFRENKYR